MKNGLKRKLTNLFNKIINKLKVFDNLIILIGLLIAIVIPNIFLMSDAFNGSKINAVNASQFGDFVGGYIGTILSFISILLLFLTLRYQREENKHQRRVNFYEKFENKYFEMIRLHRDNVNEIGGRRLFVLLIREFRLILSQVKDIVGEGVLEQKDIINISYSILFYGTGPNSTRELVSTLKNYDKRIVSNIIKKFEDNTYKKFVKKELNIKYTPFEGNQSRLGHYYRHLYQSVCFVNEQNDLFQDEKYDYVKILRAQLSNHEQAVLFLNSLSSMGKNWNNKGLIIDYRLIKNLPEDFFDKESEINIKLYYPTLIFQWEE